MVHAEVVVSTRQAVELKMSSKEEGVRAEAGCGEYGETAVQG